MATKFDIDKTLTKTQLYGVAIKRHDKWYKSNQSKVIYHIKPVFTFEEFSNLRWYFQYLCAKYQVETPMNHIEYVPLIETVDLDNEDRKRILRNKITNAKSKITATKNQLEREHNKFLLENPLFPENWTNENSYQKGIAYLEEKNRQLWELEGELLELNNKV